MVGSRLFTALNQQSLNSDDDTGGAVNQRVFDLFNRSANRQPRRAPNFGHALFHGALGVPVDDVRALLHFRFAAMGENIGAAMSMGFRHLHGIGVTKNCSTAAVYYEIAANAAIDALGASMVPRWQSPRLERLGEDSGESSDSEVLQYLRFAAEKGDAKAYEMLGLIHFHGTRGTQRNFQKAKEMLRIAAEDHESNAAYADLGHIVLHGLSDVVTESGAEVMTSSPSETAAAVGDEASAEDDGWGWNFFRAPSDQSLPPTASKPNYALAYKYYKKAALKGNADGVNGLGYMHFHGLGVDKDWDKAVEFLSRQRTTVCRCDIQHGSGTSNSAPGPRACRVAGSREAREGEEEEEKEEVNEFRDRCRAPQETHWRFQFQEKHCAFQGCRQIRAPAGYA